MVPEATGGSQVNVGSSSGFEVSHPKACPEQTVFLVSGFGPFRQHLVNSSWEAVKVKTLWAQIQELRAQPVLSVVLSMQAPW